MFQTLTIIKSFVMAPEISNVLPSLGVGAAIGTSFLRVAAGVVGAEPRRAGEGGGEG